MSRRGRSGRSASGLVAAALALAGCGIPLEGGVSAIANTCRDDSDCGTGATCAHVGADLRCVARAADLPRVLVEVRPAPGSGFVANGSNLYDLARLSSGALTFEGTDPVGQVRSFSPALPAAVPVHGAVTIKPALQGCPEAADLSIPARVELRRMPRFADLPALEGLPAFSIEAEAVAQPKAAAAGAGAALTAYAFDALVPPDDYEVYVTPEPVDGCSAAAPPPLLLPARRIDRDHPLEIAPLEPPSRLAVSIAVPNLPDIESWVFELAEPAEGRLISDSQPLPKPVDGEVHLEARYSWFEGAGAPILRLRPPEGSAAPTVYWRLDVVDLSGTQDVKLSVSDLDVAPLDVQGQVLDAAQRPVVGAAVTIQSVKLSGSVARNGSYKLSTQTDTTGGFRAKLIPGRYSVVARPATSGGQSAISVAEWDIKAGDLCCGRTLELPSLTRLEGVAVTASGQPMAGATVLLGPSMPKPTAYLVDALDAAFLPRQTSALADDRGAFSVPADPGSFDVSVRPSQDDSGFPWVVRSRLTVQGQAPTSDLGVLTVAFPAVLTGVVVGPDGQAVSGATVRAWLPVADSSSSNGFLGTVVQIGETTTGDDGGYGLALPPSLSQ
jgi:hypothetical protein